MNNTRCLRAILFVALGFSVQADPVRPNIVFAFADDWGRHASAYARVDGPGTVNDLLRTPHFDRVAEEGVLFRKAFVSAPSCTPCRSALMSGQHFRRTGDPRVVDDGRYFETPPLSGLPQNFQRTGGQTPEELRRGESIPSPR